MPKRTRKLPPYQYRRRKKGGLVHCIAHCIDCGEEWESRNAMGLAVQHTDRTGHTTSVEIGSTFKFYVD